MAEREGFLFVGTLEPGKNLDVALRALAALRGRGRPATLKVIGASGWKQSHIPALVEKLGLGNAVEFAGYLDEEGLRSAYLQARCLVFPSAYEGFGLPLLEAQSQGCSVIAADNSCQREIGGEGCLYFRDGDLDGLAELMERSLAADPQFASARAAGFRNCARFSWADTAAGTLAVYKSALRAVG
jgi:alpha-1,3-rhamnosyl/mannosyltransferase